MKTLNLKTNINALTISTVYNKFERVYETLVIDCYGDELKKITTKYKSEAEHNHIYCVSHYATLKNCIHVS